MRDFGGEHRNKLGAFRLRGGIHTVVHIRDVVENQRGILLFRVGIRTGRDVKFQDTAARIKNLDFMIRACRIFPVRRNQVIP